MKKSVKILIVVLCLIIVGLVVFMIVDKFISFNKNKNQNAVENNIVAEGNNNSESNVIENTTNEIKQENPNDNSMENNRIEDVNSINENTSKKEVNVEKNTDTTKNNTNNLVDSEGSSEYNTEDDYVYSIFEDIAEQPGENFQSPFYSVYNGSYFVNSAITLFRATNSFYLVISEDSDTYNIDDITINNTNLDENDYMCIEFSYKYIIENSEYSGNGTIRYKYGIYTGETAKIEIKLSNPFSSEYGDLLMFNNLFNLFEDYVVLTKNLG